MYFGGKRRRVLERRMIAEKIAKEKAAAQAKKANPGDDDNIFWHIYLVG